MGVCTGVNTAEWAVDWLNILNQIFITLFVWIGNRLEISLKFEDFEKSNSSFFFRIFFGKTFFKSKNLTRNFCCQKLNIDSLEWSDNLNKILKLKFHLIQDFSKEFNEAWVRVRASKTITQQVKSCWQFFEPQQLPWNFLPFYIMTFIAYLLNRLGTICFY